MMLAIKIRNDVRTALLGAAGLRREVLDSLGAEVFGSIRLPDSRASKIPP
jgi:hypothetical protein